MDDLKVPEVDVNSHKEQFRLVLIHTRKSMTFGLLLLILPFLFISGVVLKHYLHIDAWIFTSIYEGIVELDQKYGDASIWNWFIRGLLIFGPLVAIILNLMSVTHISFIKSHQELVISFKLKWLNWLIILFCGLIFSIFFFYLIIENS